MILDDVFLQHSLPSSCNQDTKSETNQHRNHLSVLIFKINEIIVTAVPFPNEIKAATSIIINFCDYIYGFSSPVTLLKHA